jgi:xanthine dehydrogenase YagS FAD-binding subunit
MKMHVETPSKLIDINPLPLRQIEWSPTGGLHIGALVRNSDLALHPDVIAHYPVLSEALLSGASPQLRNMATVGGNLLQRTRCPYFYDKAFNCNKRDPESGCAAMNGYNRSHAILGGSNKCIATHPSDMCVALVALDAIILTRGINGERSIPIASFYLEPGQTPQKENVLYPGELITDVQLPVSPFARRSHYRKVRDRTSYEFALASAAVALEMDGERIRSARVALGGVGTRPWRAYAAEKILTGAILDDHTFEVAAQAALLGASPHADNAFKIELARRTLVDTLQHLLAG